VFDADTAQERGERGEDVILVRVETNPNDVHGMIGARGVLTSTGGTASHAALVARGMGRPAVVGASDIFVDVKARQLTSNGVTIRQGDEITIDGTGGGVFAGRVKTIAPSPSADLRRLLGWADRARRLQVWANADYPRDAQRARENGAQGIGLCRTEHMFMEEDRLPIVQAMILSDNVEDRERELQKLLPIQRSDFEGILEAMRGLPVVIRLIDPPLHEFLPNYENLIASTTELRVRGKKPKKLARQEQLMRRVEELREANPMLGLRGVRLAILYPEIPRMQVRAVMEAACDLKLRRVQTKPEIMIPLVGTLAELQTVRRELETVVEAVQEEKGVKVPYKLGTMIEIPRAALTAGEIAKDAEFFSFGTNDLTQTVYGFSRDDAEGKFIVRYLENKVLPANPFETLDRDGVGRLMAIAVEEGRQARPDLEIGICGEHGGDPESIRLCDELGLDYVSCSPYRVEVARLAAARAALDAKPDAGD
ncbi:MAG: pyruvate, phosphate dikinase, partial [bacterium]|nr:pyruvate, phosphate dikinase [bacterium]